MKILHLADIHFGPSIFGDWYNKAHDKFLEYICKYLQENEIDLIIIAGDLYKKATPHRSDIKRAHKFLFSLSQYVENIIVTTGNHDLPEITPESGPITLIADFVSAFDIAKVTVPEFNPERKIQYADINIKGIHIRAFDYIGKGTYPNVVDELQELLSTCDIAVAHGTISGCKLSNTYTLNKQAVQYDADIIKNYAPRYKTIIMGDIHLPQSYKVGDTQIHYCGSPVALDFGESHQHGFMLHTISNDTIKTEFHEVKTLNPITYKCSKQITAQDELETWCKTIKSKHKFENGINICRIKFRPIGSLLSMLNYDSIIYDILKDFDLVDIEIETDHLVQEMGTDNPVINYSFDPNEVSNNIEEFCKLNKIESEDIVKRHFEISELVSQS